MFRRTLASRAVRKLQYFSRILSDLNKSFKPMVSWRLTKGNRFKMMVMSSILVPKLYHSIVDWCLGIVVDPQPGQSAEAPIIQ